VVDGKGVGGGVREGVDVKGYCGRELHHTHLVRKILIFLYRLMRSRTASSRISKHLSRAQRTTWPSSTLVPQLFPSLNQRPRHPDAIRSPRNRLALLAISVKSQAVPGGVFCVCLSSGNVIEDAVCVGVLDFEAQDKFDRCGEGYWGGRCM
jgi:hypothetical protein